MKLFKITLAMMLFGSSIFASEEEKPWLTGSYEQRKPDFEDRVINVGLGAGLVGSSALLASSTRDMLKDTEFRKPRIPMYRGFQRALLYGSLPFAAGSALFGTYFVGKGLLAKYYTSNWAWELETKRYKINRQAEPTLFKRTRETFQ
jgi:hypothetical protein